MGGFAIRDIPAIRDASGTNVLAFDVNNRILFDTAALSSVDANNRQLVDSSGNAVVYWDSKTLNFAAGVASVDWQNMILTSSVGGNFSSIDWGNRQLVWTDGTTVMLDWSGAGVLDAKTNKIINVADPVSAQDAATKHYVDSIAAAAPVWTKYTIAYGALSAAALTNSITLFSLGAKQVIHGVMIKHSAAFTGGSISAYSVEVGVTGDLLRYASPFDVFQSVGSSTFQASADLSPEDFIGATSIKVTATSVGANLSAATAGSVDVWVLVSTLP
jgi:hypothetical protein